MEKHIVDIANEISLDGGYRHIKALDKEDIETAKQIIGILVEAKLPICMAADILDFCKGAMQFLKLEGSWINREKTASD